MKSSRPAPDFEEASSAPTTTERQEERRREDDSTTAVVVKRQDQSVRHPDDTLRLAIREGAEQSRRPVLSLFLSAISAGAILGFAAMAVGLVSTFFPEGGPVPSRILVALVYPLGFVLCLVSGTQLFTEHTALAVYPVLDRRTRVRDMLRLWTVILGGNMVGCALGAALLAATEDVIGAAAGYESIATHLVKYSFSSTVLSGLLAGWLMALGGWLILATPPDVSQIVAIYITTFLIGLGGLHHSIAGASELFAAAFTGSSIAPLDIASALSAAALGNLIGGSLFVAILNYGHIRHTQKSADE